MRSFYLTIALSHACAPLRGGAPPRSVEIGYEIAQDGSVPRRGEPAPRARRAHRTGSPETWKGKKGIYALRGEAARSSRGAVVADGLRPHRFRGTRGPGAQRPGTPNSGSGRQGADVAAPGPAQLHVDPGLSPPRDTVTAERRRRWQEARSRPTHKVSRARARARRPRASSDAPKLVKRKDNPQDKATGGLVCD